jgi:hypothetical protein
MKLLPSCFLVAVLGTSQLPGQAALNNETDIRRRGEARLARPAVTISLVWTAYEFPHP